MSEVFTLEALEAELDRRYGPLVFEANSERFELRPLLRCPRDERDSVTAALKSLEDVDEADVSEDEIVDAMSYVLRTVTANGRGDKLVQALGDDLLRYQVLFEKWTEKTQAGEA
ncbi:phage tail assembly protein [Saccharothrix sp. HUAS TT1]|uniref:phage tail assembly protein n=1 Tax=unclassified Saccharothrix TaxID=2593673 RepID=UPI00345B6C17